jgi:ribonuclease HI
MEVRVYTDGACSRNGKAGAQASWAFWIPEFKDKSNSGRVPADGPQTNQRGELMGISEAVKAISEFKEGASNINLQVYTDSMYSKNCLTTWVSSWAKKNWKTTTGGDVAHRDLIQSTVERLRTFKTYVFHHVEAHTKNTDEHSKHNAVVDRMATAVIHPETEIPVITDTSALVVEGIPFTLFTAPVEGNTLKEWCLENIEKLDQDALKSALIKVFEKTIDKSGYELTKHKLHRSTMYGVRVKGLIIVS